MTTKLRRGRRTREQDTAARASHARLAEEQSLHYFATRGAGQVIRTLEQFARLCSDHPAVFVAGGVHSGEVAKVREHVVTVATWLADFSGPLSGVPLPATRWAGRLPGPGEPPSGISEEAWHRHHGGPPPRAAARPPTVETAPITERIALTVREADRARVLCEQIRFASPVDGYSLWWRWCGSAGWVWLPAEGEGSGEPPSAGPGGTEPGQASR